MNVYLNFYLIFQISLKTCLTFRPTCLTTIKIFESWRERKKNVCLKLYQSLKCVWMMNKGDTLPHQNVCAIFFVQIVFKVRDNNFLTSKHTRHYLFCYCMLTANNISFDRITLAPNYWSREGPPNQVMCYPLTSETKTFKSLLCLQYKRRNYEKKIVAYQAIATCTILI